MIARELVTPALALLLVVSFGQLVPRWTRRLPPALAVRLLLATSAVATAAQVLLLTMLALPLVGRVDQLADYANWSDAVFRRSSSPGFPIAAAASVATAAVLLRTARQLRTQLHAVAAARAFRRDLGPTAGDVMVVASEVPEAMAINGDLILVTAGLIRCLDPVQRRAVLAHERSHVSHRHDRHARVARLIAAANPLLFRVPPTVDYLIERWADEDAVGVTSRNAVASALACAAARGAAAPVLRTFRPPIALAAATVAVERRILALQGEEPRARMSLLLLPLVQVLSVVAVSLMVTERTFDLFQLAIR